jgi:ABC-type polysaccharide/polyol phosphate export permease
LSTTKASSFKPGFLGTFLGSLATFYERRWLVKYLVQRQMASNYRNSHLGVLWAFLGPLMMVALFTLVFSEVLGIKFREVTGDSALNFGLFMYCGYVPFLAFSQALSQGVVVMRRNRDLVTKVVFPLELLPLAQVLSSFVQNMFFGLLALQLVLVVLDQRVHWTILLLPLIMLPQLLFTLGASYLMAVFGTYVPDIKEGLRAFVRAMFFITPIVWPAGRVPEGAQFLVTYNPLAFLVEAYRQLILEGKLPFGEWAVYFCFVAVTLFVVGLALFNRVKHNFGDKI